MVERIGDDGILFREQRFEQTSVRIKASRIENSILGAEEVGYDTLELFVRILCAADETHRCHAVAACVHTVFGCLNQFGIVRQTEVVVRAEIDHFLPALYGDAR